MIHETDHSMAPLLCPECRQPLKPLPECYRTERHPELHCDNPYCTLNWFRTRDIEAEKKRKSCSTPLTLSL